MTTIAYKAGIVAYDSRYVCHETIVDDSAEKCIIKDGVFFFISGSVSDYEHLVDSYLIGKATKRRIDAKAIVFDHGTLYTSSVDHTGFWRCSERFDNHFAIGCGSPFALAYMDTGMTAEEAVKATCNRDIYTGGTIRTCNLIKND